MKQEGNVLVKKGHFQEALEKYSECLVLKPDECALYTNRYGVLKHYSLNLCNRENVVAWLDIVLT